MATFLYKLGRLSFRQRRWVAVIWISVLLAVGAASFAGGGEVEEEFTLPGTESQQAFDLMEEAFPGSSADAIAARIVFQAPDGEEITSPENTAVIEDVLGRFDGADRVVAVTSPFETGSVSEDGSTAFGTVDYNASWADITDDMRDQLFTAVDAGRDAGLTVEASGEIAMAEVSLGQGELIGIAVAAIVLIITFGSLVAAGLPLITALIGVGVGMSAIGALSVTLGLSEMTGILAMMIGLAVGIDYALFIASRYRSELVAGHSREEAAGRAVGTAGSAVVFAGLTVIIALGGLAVVNITLLTKMGLAAAGTVLLAVLVALTLVPAALGFVGKRIFGRKTRAANPETNVPPTLQKDGRPNMGSRWAAGVLRRPLVVLVSSVAVLGVMAVPVFGMQLGLPDDGTQPADSTQRKAYDMLSDGFGPGFNGPLLLVLDGSEAADPQAAADTLGERLNGVEGIAAAYPAQFNEDGTVATMAAIPSSGPASSETTDLVAELRGEVAPQFQDDTGMRMLVSGQTAAESDFSQVLSDALVPYLALVVGLAFVLLTLVFRSLLVPLKAALGFLLSVLAALGSVVAVFQWGWLAGLLGVSETGPIMSMMPIFMVGVIFGLAMDYEVFLVTRMREAYVHGEDPRQAVISGFNLNARVVTAAAVIMISVFAAFAFSSAESMIKMMGFGLAMAILLDAFLVRMTIVPAMMGLIGDRAWWLPKWLDRALPNVDVEGSALEKHLATGSADRAAGVAGESGDGGEAEDKDREPVTVR
ncbi:MMPL family transporter [Streptomyces otsuchiensis]|uniref:MMPL family transporter n=1 Tax=Streptomyces otsuchiensis TaxID=2681388 RepID=UPI0010312AE8|nr:MMPL family transporter [Streptomyces otsuchiensis]